MGNILVVNVTGQETRVALVEKGVLAELYVERQNECSIVGNIYKGKVLRVLPGMQAAFVDIGTDKAAFLYVTDVLREHFAFELNDDEEDEDDEDYEDGAEAEGDENGSTGPRRKRGRRRRKKPNGRIEELLKEGQSILVQAAKDPIGTKGARLTCHISLPGRHLVFMPTVDHIGISRRITSESERRRLRDLVEEMRPDGSGFIARTAAESEPTEHLRADMELLIRLWSDILETRDKVSPPAQLHADLDLVFRATRDLVTRNVSKIVVDDRAQFERIPDFIRRYMPGFSCQVELYTGREPIFEAYGIEMEIERALQRKVWLKSGGYLVIDQTEALTAIDVNTGKYVGKTNLEETITKTNLEAVDEVVYQLRLRDIGGLIIIDFIDMEVQANREKVYQALVKALEADRTRTNLLKFSDFGLVEMTRKRVKESLVRQLCEPCPYCSGRGHIKSDATVAYEILRKFKREASHNLTGEFELSAHTDVTRFLKANESAVINRVENHYQTKLRLRGKGSNHREEYNLAEARPRRTWREKGPSASSGKAEGSGSSQSAKPVAEAPTPADAPAAKSA
jgi:ribonuclease G